MESVNFKKFYSSFLGNIIDNDIELFGKLKTDEERIKSIFGFPYAHNYKISIKQNSKSENLAKDFKEKGNYAFQKDMFKAAADQYSKGIILQPQNNSGRNSKFILHVSVKTQYFLSKYVITNLFFYHVSFWLHLKLVRYKFIEKKLQVHIGVS